LNPITSARRVGLFGGAFDPPHQAHVALARAAIDQLGLDELRVLPTGQAWHKARALSPAAHRLAMARLAFDGLPQVRIDERELQREGPTYTIDTLQALASELPGAEFHLLMGADQWAAFDTWRRWQDIAALARICVLARPGAPAPLPRPGWPVPDVLNLPPMDCSATAIRDALAAGGLSSDLARMLPEAVARYISAHGLYGHPLPGDAAPTS
jgi:nicotinate-nucleotide adenylyltransferase